MDSGVLQPTVFQARIIFADAGCISPRLQKSLIRDERPQLGENDLLETAELYDAPIIIGSDFPPDALPENTHMSSRSCYTEGSGRHATSWHVWYDETAWAVAEFRSVPMSDVHPRQLDCYVHPCLRDRECAMMHLIPVSYTHLTLPTKA